MYYKTFKFILFPYEHNFFHFYQLLFAYIKNFINSYLITRIWFALSVIYRIRYQNIEILIKYIQYFLYEKSILYSNKKHKFINWIFFKIENVSASILTNSITSYSYFKTSLNKLLRAINLLKKSLRIEIFYRIFY